MNCVQRSITEKWEPILRGEHKPMGTVDCACCVKFFFGRRFSEGTCRRCPIYKYTKHSGCARTPNVAFETLIEDYNYDIHAELTACAQWEIDFLHEVLEAQ